MFLVRKNIDDSEAESGDSHLWRWFEPTRAMTASVTVSHSYPLNLLRPEDEHSYFYVRNVILYPVRPPHSLRLMLSVYLLMFPLSLIYHFVKILPTSRRFTYFSKTGNGTTRKVSIKNIIVSRPQRPEFH